jgi:hypothetical protein
VEVEVEVELGVPVLVLLVYYADSVSALSSSWQSLEEVRMLMGRPVGQAAGQALVAVEVVEVELGAGGLVL